MMDRGAGPKHDPFFNREKYLPPGVDDRFSRKIQVPTVGFLYQSKTFKPSPVESCKIRHPVVRPVANNEIARPVLNFLGLMPVKQCVLLKQLNKLVF